MATTKYIINGFWWKCLGVVLFLYVLIGGLSVPLGSGVQHILPSNAKSGDTVDLTIKGYNTHFNTSLPTDIWLKLDSQFAIKNLSHTVIDPTTIQAQFVIPTRLDTNKKIVPLSLIVSHPTDGTFVQPNALFVTQNEALSINPSEWQPFQSITFYNNDQIHFPYRSILYETIRNTFFHVAIWFAMFILLLIGLYNAVKYLQTRQLSYDRKSYALHLTAIVYGTIGIVTGSIWAKFTWDTYWTDDIKLNMTAIAMLIYYAYFILRSTSQDQEKVARITSAYSIFAFAALIPLVFVIPRLTDSLHPGNGGNPAFGGEDLDNTLRLFFYPSIIALTLIGYWASHLYWRYMDLISTYWQNKYSIKK